MQETLKILGDQLTKYPIIHFFQVLKKIYIDISRQVLSLEVLILNLEKDISEVESAYGDVELIKKTVDEMNELIKPYKFPDISRNTSDNDFSAAINALKKITNLDKKLGIGSNALDLYQDFVKLSHDKKFEFKDNQYPLLIDANRDLIDLNDVPYNTFCNYIENYYNNLLTYISHLNAKYTDHVNSIYSKLDQLYLYDLDKKLNSIKSTHPAEVEKFLPSSENPNSERSVVDVIDNIIKDTNSKFIKALNNSSSTNKYIEELNDKKKKLNDLKSCLEQVKLSYTANLDEVINHIHAYLSDIKNMDISKLSINTYLNSIVLDNPTLRNIEYTSNPEEIFSGIFDIGNTFRDLVVEILLKRKTLDWYTNGNIDNIKNLDVNSLQSTLKEYFCQRYSGSNGYQGPSTSMFKIENLEDANKFISSLLNICMLPDTIIHLLDITSDHDIGWGKKKDGGKEYHDSKSKRLHLLVKNLKQDQLNSKIKESTGYTDTDTDSLIANIIDQLSDITRNTPLLESIVKNINDYSSKIRIQSAQGNYSTTKFAYNMLYGVSTVVGNMYQRNNITDGMSNSAVPPKTLDNIQSQLQKYIKDRLSTLFYQKTDYKDFETKLNNMVESSDLKYFILLAMEYCAVYNKELKLEDGKCTIQEYQAPKQRKTGFGLW